MILTCPNCGTQYVVKDDSIPPEGRQVRCAACKHSWHQDPLNAAAADEIRPDEVEAVSEPEAASDAGQPAGDEGIAEATMIDPRSGPEIEQRAYEENVIEGGADTETAETAPTVQAEETAAVTATQAPADWDEPPHAEAASDVFSPFAAADEVEPRRRGFLTILLVMLLIIAAAAAFWFLAPPGLKARLGLAAAGTSPLALGTTHMDRQKLESGNELLTVTGRVINPTTREQDVPPLQAQLLNHGGKVVYSWTIAPPARSLPAGASASFNSAEVNVPPGGNELRITFGPSRS